MAERPPPNIDLSPIDAISRLRRLTRAAAWRSKRLGEPVAQLVEHETFNLGVVGSIPTGLTKLSLIPTRVDVDVSPSIRHAVEIIRHGARRLSRLQSTIFASIPFKD